MNAPLPTAVRFDIHGLAEAISNSHAADALRCRFNDEQWAVLASYMQPFTLKATQLLIQPGSLDRTVYFVESGTLSVRSEDERAQVHMALVDGGSVLGEGAFFSHLPRPATVHAATPCKLWCVTPMRFGELSSRYTAIALELTTAMAGVLAKRLSSRPRRAAVT